MPTGFAVETMHIADIPEVVEIEKACFTTPWPASAYRRELKSPSSTRYLVVRHYLTEPSARPEVSHEKKSGLISRLLPFLKPGDTEEAAENGPKNPNPVVGYGGLWLMMDEAHITTLGVAPEYRGKALGEFLLIGLIDVALALGASWLTLEVRVSNTVAQNLYKKYTFKETGRRYKYYTDNNEDAFIMWSDELTKLSFREKYKTLKTELLEKLARQGELAAPAGSPLPVNPARPLVVPELPAETTSELSPEQKLGQEQGN